MIVSSGAQPDLCIHPNTNASTEVNKEDNSTSTPREKKSSTSKESIAVTARSEKKNEKKGIDCDERRTGTTVTAGT